MFCRTCWDIFFITLVEPSPSFDPFLHPLLLCLVFPQKEQVILTPFLLNLVRSVVPSSSGSLLITFLGLLALLFTSSGSKIAFPLEGHKSFPFIGPKNIMICCQVSSYFVAVLYIIHWLKILFAIGSTGMDTWNLKQLPLSTPTSLVFQVHFELLIWSLHSKLFIHKVSRYPPLLLP